MSLTLRFSFFRTPRAGIPARARLPWGMPGRRRAPLGRGGARPAGGALALRRAGRGGAGSVLRRGPCGVAQPGRGVGPSRLASPRCEGSAAAGCGGQPGTRGYQLSIVENKCGAVKSRWYLWSVPTDVTNRSVLIAEVGALAVVGADGTLLISKEHCWQSSEECLRQWDSGVALCHGQVRGIFVLSVFIPFFFLAV